MVEAIQYINLILTLLAFGIIGLLWKALKAQKETIEAQKTIVDNFKAQSDYLKNVQNTVTELFKPDTIESIVKAEQRKSETEYQEKIDKIKRSGSEALQNVIDILKENVKSRTKYAVVIASFKLIYPETYENLSKLLDEEEIKDINGNSNAMKLMMPQQRNLIDELGGQLLSKEKEPQ
jgi:hypothetical protein